MLELHAIVDPDARRRRRAIAASRSRGRAAARRRRRRSTGCWCPASRSTPPDAGWATAAATTTGCCRCCRRDAARSPARSTLQIVAARARRAARPRASTRSSPRRAQSSTGRRAAMNGDAAPPDARARGVALAATLAIQIFTSLAGDRDGGAGAGDRAATSASRRQLDRRLRRARLRRRDGGEPRCRARSIERYGAIRVSQALRAALRRRPRAGAARDRRRRRRSLRWSSAPSCIGLGYGPITPASSQVLARTAPPARMALDVLDQADRRARPAPRWPAPCCRRSRCRSAGGPRCSSSSRSGIVVVAAARADARRARRRAATRTRRVSRGGIARPAAARARATARCASSRWSRSPTPRRRCRLTSFLVVYLTEALGWSLVAAGLSAHRRHDRRRRRPHRLGRARRPAGVRPRSVLGATRRSRRP